MNNNIVLENNGNGYSPITTVINIKASGNNDTPLAIEPTVFGAVYNGVTDCAQAIQKCLDIGGNIRLMGSGRVLVKSTLVIKHDNTSIIVDDGITIVRATNTNAPLIATVGGMVWEQEESPTEHLQNINIIGGTWEFNGAGQNIPNDGIELFQRPGMRLSEVDNLYISNLKVNNNKGFCFLIADINRYVIENIHFIGNNMNTDGFHLSGNMYDGVIRHITGATKDDLIAINVSGDGPRTEEYTSNPFREGECKRLYVHDIQMTGSMDVARLLCSEDYTIDEVVFDGIFGTYTPWNGIINISDWKLPAHIGRVVVKNVFAESTTSAAYIVGVGDISNLGCKVDSLILENVQIKQTTTGHNNLVAMKSNGSISNLIINNVDIAYEGNTDYSDHLIKGGTIGVLMMNNIISGKSEQDTKMQSVRSGDTSKMFLSNCLMDLQTAPVESGNVHISNCEFHTL